MSDFQRNLIIMRKEHNLTMEELGNKIGVNKTAVSKWENGKTTPRLDRLFALCEVFGCDIKELVGGKP